MPSTFTQRKRLEKQATGENDNTWGDLLNNVLDQLDQIIAGGLAKTVSGSGNVTLTDAEARPIVQTYTGTLTASIDVNVPQREAFYFVYNNTSGGFDIRIRTAAATGITVPPGDRLLLFCDGTTVRRLSIESALYDTFGNRILDFLDTPSAVNRVRIRNAATGGPPQIEVVGPDPEIALRIKSKSAGGPGDIILSDDNDLEILVLHHVGAAVNEITIDNAKTGDAPAIKGGGADPDVAINLQPKGTAGLLVNGNLLLMKGLIDGCRLNNDPGDADHDLAFNPGQAVDSTGRAMMQLGSPIIKQIDAVWAAGSNVGGRASAVGLSPNQTYFCFLLRNPTNNAIEAGFDNALNASNLLADATGFTQFRRVGAILTDGASNIRGFVQKEDRFLFKSIVQDLGQANPTTSATLHSLTVPTGIDVEADVAVEYITNDAGTFQAFGLITSPGQNDDVPSISRYNIRSERQDAAGFFTSGTYERLTRTDTSGRIRSRFSSTSGDVTIHTNGWSDDRGASD